MEKISPDAVTVSTAQTEPRPGRLGRAFFRLTEVSNGLGTVWVFGLMILICADITFRYFLNAPIRGVAEIVAFSIVGCVFLQLANTLMSGRITRADLFLTPYEGLSRRAALPFHIVFNGAGASIMALIAWRTWPDMIAAFQGGDYYGARGDFTFPTWPIKALVVWGSGLSAAAFVVLALGKVRASLEDERDVSAGGWIGIAVLILTVTAGVYLFQTDLGRTGIGVASVAMMLVLVYLGMHIGVALLVLAMLGIVMLKGTMALALSILALAANGAISDYIFGVVPLFVLMGLVVGGAGFGRDTFDVAQAAVGRIRGGLGIATVGANAFFAAITGVSIASAAIFTKVAVPEMVAHGYTHKFAVGVVAGSSVLGMLIPPSILLIVYGFLAEVSVGQLFIAAALPGVVLAAAFAAAILLMARYTPGFVGRDIQDLGLRLSRSAFASKLAPIVVLMGLVLGGIYGGIFTPTEAGAAGAAGAIVIALLKSRLSLSDFKRIMIETGHVTVSILFLIIAASVYSRMLTLTGIPMSVAGFMGEMGLGFYGFMLIYVLVVLVMGTILDSTSIMLIILPLVLPVVTALGGDLIWFGIVTVIAVEMGLLTPPLGISVYVVKASLTEDMPLDQIFRGAFPFVLVMAAVTILLIFVPQIATILL